MEKNTKELDDYFEGTFKTLKNELIKFDSKSEIKDYLSWFLEKVRINYNFKNELKLLGEIKKLDKETNVELINKLRKEKSKFVQKDKPYVLNVGDVINIKFGIGIGHEIKKDHYGVILSRKGTMFLIAPLNSEYQDYGEYTVCLKNLGLPKESERLKNYDDSSYISFSQIRHIHCNRITKIKKIKSVENYEEKRHIDIEKVKEIVDNYYKIMINDIDKYLINEL